MDALAEYDWSDLHGDTFELHTALDCLNTNLTTVIDSLVPLKVVRPTKEFDPWMDAGLIVMQTLGNVSEAEKKSIVKSGCVKNSTHALFLLTMLLFRPRFRTRWTTEMMFWRELRNLGLLLKHQEELHGNEPDSLNLHFA